MNKNPIFILGAHKSGTSLLRSLFDGHSELFVIPIEAHFFQHNGYWVDYGIRRQYPENINEKQIINNYIEWIDKSNTTPGGFADSDTRGLWDITKFKEKIKQGTDYSNIKKSIENYIEAMYYSLYNEELPNDIRVVEKSVENAEFAIELKKIFPNAKFVHIIRNPYSNLVSIRKFKSKRGYPFLKRIIASLYNSYYFLEKNQRIITKDYLVIKYEDLVTKPKKIINEISDFLDIAKEEILYKPTVQGQQWHGNSTTGKKFKTISSERLFKWKEEINPLEVRIINKKFKYIIDKYNYNFYENKNKKHLLYPAKQEGLKVYIANRILYNYF
ncbi:sulfotransferase family protein [Halothermothrix orenii]|uniref:Sulfotransferase n=1 Tax=Halothermothrix orenii (strain H 168 / OCM 544 / DSM 9562) TaxID=373903 RepID=B8D177_HALOH|nr:sulfotransferase [Halothermothrix orenii]ACL71029.1 sulfotransferase [Halothermothrix orenii H 168]